MLLVDFEEFPILALISGSIQDITRWITARI